MSPDGGGSDETKALAVSAIRWICDSLRIGVTWTHSLLFDPESDLKLDEMWSDDGNSEGEWGVETTGLDDDGGTGDDDTGGNGGADVTDNAGETLLDPFDCGPAEGTATAAAAAAGGGELANAGDGDPWGGSCWTWAATAAVDLITAAVAAAAAFGAPGNPGKGTKGVWKSAAKHKMKSN